MARTKPARRSPQHSLSIPKSLRKEIKEAMALDGITNFSQFALAAVLQRAARIKRHHALEEAQTMVEIVPKLRALLAEIEKQG